MFISLLFAYSATLRALVWSFYALPTTKFITETGIYSYFFERKHSEQIFAQTSAKIDKMKTEKRGKVFKKRVEAQGLAKRKPIKDTDVNGSKTGEQKNSSSSEMRLRDLLCGLDLSLARHRNKRKDNGFGHINSDIENGSSQFSKMGSSLASR